MLRKFGIRNDASQIRISEFGIRRIWDFGFDEKLQTVIERKRKSRQASETFSEGKYITHSEGMNITSRKGNITHSEAMNITPEGQYHSFRRNEYHFPKGNITHSEAMNITEAPSLRTVPLSGIFFNFLCKTKCLLQGVFFFYTCKAQLMGII